MRCSTGVGGISEFGGIRDSTEARAPVCVRHSATPPSPRRNAARGSRADRPRGGWRGRARARAELRSKRNPNTGAKRITALTGARRYRTEEETHAIRKSYGGDVRQNRVFVNPDFRADADPHQSGRRQNLARSNCIGNAARRQTCASAKRRARGF